MLKELHFAFLNFQFLLASSSSSASLPRKERPTPPITTVNSIPLDSLQGRHSGSRTGELIGRLERNHHLDKSHTMAIPDFSKGPGNSKPGDLSEGREPMMALLCR